VVDLNRWGNIDMVMNEGVIQPVVRLDGAIELYRVSPTEEHEQASREAHDHAIKGLDEWRLLVAGEPTLTALAATISRDLESFEAQLQRLTAIARQRQDLLSQFEAVETGLAGKLDDAMETIVDPAKKQAEAADDLPGLAAWSDIDMVMNEAVIANTLKLQAGFDTYFFSGEEPDFQSLQRQYQTLHAGLADWNGMLRNHPGMAAVSRDAAALIGAFDGLITSLRENQQQSQKTARITEELARGILGHLHDAMEGIIDPAKEQAMARAEANKARIIQLLLIAIAVSLAAAGGFGLALARSISLPLKKTVVMLDEMERGHVANRLNLGRRGDEIGQMAATMDRFADSLQQEIIEALTRLAKGDLTFEAHPRDQQDLLRGALSKLGADLNRTFDQIQTVAAQLDSGSDQVSDTSQSLSQGATESAAALEQITASMNQISAQTGQSAAGANEAHALSGRVMEAAAKGTEEMQRMVEAMSDINHASQNISKIIKTIDEIAFQTNLLALNAAVEAARAGQHGKGFAVVAEEVRNLAARSSRAAQETTSLIESSVAKAANGHQIAERTATALDEIVAGVAKFNGLVGEIATAAQEQVLAIGQINQGLSQIDQATQNNTANAEESAAAEELSSQASELRQLLAQFKLREELVKPPRMVRIEPPARDFS
jgi:methyl-accepting chemotaxis protein